jgi:predicted transcriptional regulator
LEDLNKLKYIMEETNIKVNKTAIARDLGCDPRTVDKYIKGYKKNKTRNRMSSIDDYYNQIKALLNSQTQIFYYKSVLWQYLVDNHNLKCAQSTFRRYISKCI